MSQEPPTPPLPPRDELARRIIARSTHSDTALLVLLLIALYSDKTSGETAISTTTLAKLTRHTKSHIASHVLPQLRASGELVQVRSGNTGGAPPHPNVYRIAERLYV